MPVTYTSENEEFWKQYPYEVGELCFPKDEGIHDYKREWWYLNLYLTHLPSGKHYGVMLTYFPKQKDLPHHMRLFQITDFENKTFIPHKKFAFGSLNVSDENHNISFRKFLHWDRWRQISGYPFQYSVRAKHRGCAIDLAMCSRKPPLPVNGTGKVPMGSDGTSYYYSLTRLNVAGYLRLDRSSQIPVVGTGWVDHQFGDFDYTEKYEGYEWFSIKLDNNVDIICWNVFEDGASVNPVMTYMLSDNSVEVPETFSIDPMDYWISPKMRKYPSKWRLTEPSRKLDIIIDTVIPNQLLYLPYPWREEKIEIYLVGLYEGNTTIEGTYEGRQVRGAGFAELTHTLE